MRTAVSGGAGQCSKATTGQLLGGDDRTIVSGRLFPAFDCTFGRAVKAPG
jgi:hypothetical protein